MTLLEAIHNRHSVRSYIQEPLAGELCEKLNEFIEKKNEESGLHMQLVVGEPKAFQGFNSYGAFKGVENYIVLVGKKSADIGQTVGYYGEQVVLYAQTLGLNTCWVGLTYSKVSDKFVVEKGEKVYCVISIGYGESQGHSHKIKRVDQVSNVSDTTPAWFLDGVNAALLAPTAVNQQKFYFEYLGENASGKPVVRSKRSFSIVGYTKIDMGIARLHFEIGAGKDNFVWEKQ